MAAFVAHITSGLQCSFGLLRKQVARSSLKKLHWSTRLLDEEASRQVLLTLGSTLGLTSPDQKDTHSADNFAVDCPDRWLQ